MFNSSMTLLEKAKEILADYDAGRPIQVQGDGWLVRFAAFVLRDQGSSEVCQTPPQVNRPENIRVGVSSADIRKLVSELRAEEEAFKASNWPRLLFKRSADLIEHLTNTR